MLSPDCIIQIFHNVEWYTGGLFKKIKSLFSNLKFSTSPVEFLLKTIKCEFAAAEG